MSLDESVANRGDLPLSVDSTHRCLPSCACRPGVEEAYGPLEEGEVRDMKAGLDRTLKKSGACRVRHLVRLRLTSSSGAVASDDAPILLVREQLAGVPPGELTDGVPPPPPVPLKPLTKLALFILGIMTFVISLSFMMPVKFEWMVTKLGCNETAECAPRPPPATARDRRPRPRDSHACSQLAAAPARCVPSTAAAAATATAATATITISRRRAQVSGAPPAQRRRETGMDADDARLRHPVHQALPRFGRPAYVIAQG